jgi:hypothetical protein
VNSQGESEQQESRLFVVGSYDRIRRVTMVLFLRPIPTFNVQYVLPFSTNFIFHILSNVYRALENKSDGYIRNRGSKLPG